MQRRKLEELSLMDDFLFNAMYTVNYPYYSNFKPPFPAARF